MTGSQKAWRVWGGIFVLSLLEGSGWVFDQVAPGVLHGLLRTAVHDGLLTCGFAVASCWERGERRQTFGLWVKLAVWATILFALPRILAVSAGGHIDGLTELLISLLVPVAVVVVVAQRSVSFGVDENPLRLLMPAVAGLGGATLILPFYWPPSIVGRVWLVALAIGAVLAGFAVVRLHVLLRGVGKLRGAAVMFGAVSVAAAAFCWVDWSPPVWVVGDAAWEVVRLALVEAPIALLTVWLLREMAPVRFSARWLLVVLVAIAESFVAEHPRLMWTTALGVALLAGGAIGLLRADSQEVL
jgi:hypothetical protein